MPPSRAWFPGLNALRFLAAATVMLHHLEQLKSDWGLPNLYDSRGMQEIGGLAVTFFFVLSGFLVTWLLLEEEARKGRIDVASFYLRRALRIWPVYFLVLLAGWFVLEPLLPLGPWATDRLAPSAGMFALFVLMLPNVAVLLGPTGHLTPLWSIGVEEQFYLVWPHLLRRFRNRLALFLGIIATLAASRELLRFALAHARGRTLAALLPAAVEASLHELIVLANHTLAFLNQFRVDCMALGALGALLVRSPWRDRALALLPPQVQALLYVGLGVLLAQGASFGPVTHQVYALLFLAVILSVSCSPRPLVRLDHPVLDHLGDLSYGIYGYHLAGIALTIALLQDLPVWDRGAGTLLLTQAMTAFFTLGLAALSFRFYETPFLRLKDRLSVIRTR